jgi:hypothetical protein
MLETATWQSKAADDPPSFYSGATGLLPAILARAFKGEL